mgnify:CR=1 FL=1
MRATLPGQLARQGVYPRYPCRVFWSPALVAVGEEVRGLSRTQAQPGLAGLQGLAVSTLSRGHIALLAPRTIVAGLAAHRRLQALLPPTTTDIPRRPPICGVFQPRLPPR